jgi:hypothetical protein
MSKVFTLDFITFLFVSQLCYSACVQLRVDNFQDPPARSATQPFNSLLIHVILVIYDGWSYFPATTGQLKIDLKFEMKTSDSNQTG